MLIGSTPLHLSVLASCVSYHRSETNYQARRRKYELSLRSQIREKEKAAIEDRKAFFEEVAIPGYLSSLSISPSLLITHTPLIPTFLPFFKIKYSCVIPQGVKLDQEAQSRRNRLDEIKQRKMAELQVYFFC